MIKPLLRTMPALSGNVKLGCEVSKYTQIDKDTFTGVVRTAHLYPLSSKSFQKTIEVSLLNSSWEFDLCKFYGVYNDTFYSDLFKYDKENPLHINDLNDIINDRNADFEYGCKRVSYQKSGYQLCFYAPIYCESIEDIPDYFELSVTLENTNVSKVTKKIRIDLSNKISYNYLYLYLQRYFKQIDDSVIFMTPESQQAVYYGIDVLNGGFNAYKDNVISKVYTTETTINGFDAALAQGFKRNHLIMKQIMPLSFYFNITDILTEKEKLQYINSKLHVSGAYFKDGVKLNFYNFNDNYTYLNLPVLQMEQSTGDMKYKFNDNNILDLNNRYSLREANYIGYKHSNKVNKSYARWKLKYSDDVHPYITNNNYSFSFNQGLYNLYYQYPQNYFYSNLLCNFDNFEINVLLPIGSNIDKYYSDYLYIVNKYNLSMNNYISTWFEPIYEKDLGFVIDNTHWADVHPDGKVFYKGLLYNFNGIYDNEDITNKIDKFAILLYINDSNIISKESERNYVLAQSSLATESAGVTPNINSYLQFDSTSPQLYDLENNYSYCNSFFNLNDYFSYNKRGEGKFVDLYEVMSYYGEDIYDINKYYDINDLKITNAQDKVLKNKEITAYEILPFSYISNLTDNKGNIIIDTQNISYSYNNGVLKMPLNALNITTASENRNSYILYKEHVFLSYKTIKDYNATTQDAEIIVNSEYPKYAYLPIYKTNNNIAVEGAFTYLDDHNRFYGNKVSVDKINSDNDVLYLDPYNIKDEMLKYYQMTGEFYISEIGDEYITLSNITTDDEIVVYVDDRDKESVLKVLDYKNTYIGYAGSAYNIPKLITSLNNIILTYSLAEDYFNDYDNYTYYTTSTALNIYGVDRVMPYTLSTNTITFNPKPQTHYEDEKNKMVCYGYAMANTDIFNTNKFIANPYNNTTYISGYMYVSYIDETIFSFNISDFAGNTFTYACSNIWDFYDLGVKFGCMHFDTTVNNFVVNQNCIGTYMYKNSYLFDNPQKVITKISNVPYSTNNNFDFANAEITVNDYDLTNNIYEYSDNRETGYKYNREIEMYQKYIDTRYKETPINVYNYTEDAVNTVLQNILYNTNTTIAPIMYGKFLNRFHILMFKKELYQYAQNHADDELLMGELNNETNMLYDYIFVKINNIVNSHIQPVFVPVSKYFGKNFNLIDNITSEGNSEFVINGETYELYFKKNFIKVSKPIYENIIKLNSEKYHDLYIYRLETDNDTSRAVKFVNNAKLSKYSGKYNAYPTNSYSLVPLFNNVKEQLMQDTVLYSKYLLNQITPVEFYDTNYTYTFYRYNKPDKVMLYDVSELYTYSAETTYEPNIIYDTLRTELKSYTYVTRINETEYTFLTNKVSYYSYSYYSSKFATYDDYGDFSSTFQNISNVYDIDFDKYKLNTYTYNGKTYGFYLIEVNLANISDVFNVMYLNFETVKYFTEINGVSIVNNHKYLTDIFPKLMPSMNYNILSQLYNMSTLHTQYKTSIKKEYYNINHGDYTQISYSDDLNATLTLYRYYDNIVPLITETSNIYTEYALKGKTLKHIDCDDVIYKLDSANIYNYTGIRIYTNNSEYTIYKQPEYKYFNDNCFYNLELGFDIFVGNSLTYLEVLYYEQEDIVKKWFEKYINKNRISKLTNSEILFLYNKYDIIYEAYSIKLDSTTSEKLYSLTYKFTLK